MWTCYSCITACVILCDATLPPLDGVPAFSYCEVGASRGIKPHLMAEGIGGGLSAEDFDNDGDIDVFVPNAAGLPDQLYRNLGNGYFEEIGLSASVDTPEGNQCALWFDYDADRDLDLLIGNGESAGETSYRLLRQVADAVFEEVTAEAGLIGGDFTHQGGLCAGDINHDGYLDLYAVPWGGPGALYLNNQDGTFANISVASGVGISALAYWQPMMADFNRDGWLDIYTAVDVAPNVLWINQQDNTFVNLADSANADNTMNDMGMSLGDYDNDGDLDIYTTNIFEAPPDGRNILLRNDTVGSNVTFTEVSKAAGVDDGSWGWGCTFLDADNDGLLDIAATNGFGGEPFASDHSRFFHHLGGDPATFEDVSDAVGFNDAYWGSGLIAFDSDRDGDLDLMQTCAEGHVRFLENQLTAGPAANYLVIQPRMDGSNYRAIGAVVRVSFGSTNLMRQITAGTSFMSQEPAEAFFGLGPTAVADSVTVEWPDGTDTTLNNVCAGQVLEVMPGDPSPTPYAVHLALTGPTTLAERTVRTFQAMGDLCDGSSGDLTEASSWEVVSGASWASFSEPGSLNVGDVVGDQNLTLRVSHEGLEATLEVLVEDSDPLPPLDTTPPLVTIVSPSTNGIFSTTDATVELSGKVSDDGILVSVSWSNERGGNGPCIGLASWSTSSIPLTEGENTLVVTAADAAGNQGSAQLVVSMTPVSPPIDEPVDDPIDPVGTDPTDDVIPPITDDSPIVDPEEPPDDGTIDDDTGQNEEPANSDVEGQGDDSDATTSSGSSGRSPAGGACGSLGLIAPLALMTLLAQFRRRL